MTIRHTTRNLAWRLGRRIYMTARGEPRSGDMLLNGEDYVQRAVLSAIDGDVPLVVFDIGANQGDWSTLFHRNLAQRKGSAPVAVHCFEPVPSTAARLRENIGTLAASANFHIHQLALSDSDGAARIAIMSETGGQNTIHAEASQSANSVEVETQTLATFYEANSIGHIHLAKCDAEGHDPAVLRGALPLLAAGRIDVFQFEYNACWIHSRSFLKDIFDMVRDLPYVVGRVGPDAIEFFDSWNEELERFFYANYVLVRRPLMSWFDHRVGRIGHGNTFASLVEAIKSERHPRRVLKAGGVEQGAFRSSGGGEWACSDDLAHPPPAISQF